MMKTLISAKCVIRVTNPMQSIIISYFKSPVGELIIGSYKEKLCICDWRFRKMRSAVDKRFSSALNAEFETGSSEIIQQTIQQLTEYFDLKRSTFDLPLLFVGTDFQKQVWNELIKVPFGETRSYIQLAKSLKNEGAIRAVASANGANAISIVVPCHRIIGADGSLTGYAGGVPAKKKLLMLEGALISDQLELF